MSNTSGWKELYEAAVLESDPVELERRIRECEGAILHRLKQVTDNPYSSTECLEIETASAALLRLKSDKLGWPAVSLEGGSSPSANSRMPSYDIFCGDTDGESKWVESVEGLAASVDRMDSIATQHPRLYFVFDQRNRKVMARANSKHRHKPPADEFDRFQYDIFSGSPESDALWLERVQGRTAAIERMQAIAIQKPGDYFVFGGGNRQVVAVADTTKPKRSRENQ